MHIESLEEYVERIKKNPTKNWIYLSISYSPLSLIGASVVKDDYFFAYKRLFESFIDIDKNYTLLQELSTEAVDVTNEAMKIIEEFRSWRSAKIQEFQYKFDAIRKEIFSQKNYILQSSSTDVRRLLEIIQNYFVTMDRKSGHKPADIYNIVILPIRACSYRFSSNEAEHFSELVNGIREYAFEHELLEYRGKTTASHLEYRIGELKKIAKEFEPISKFWNDQLSKKL